MAEESSSRLEEASALDCVQDCGCDDERTSTVTYYCSWFRRLCCRRNPSHGYDTCQEELEAVKDHHGNWSLKVKRKGLKKVKALIEILGESKWKKLFMPRMRWTCRSSGGGGGVEKNKRKRMQFQYDPESYALNFDDGVEKEGDDGAYLDFSARYACPLGINRESMGLEVM